MKSIKQAKSNLEFCFPIMFHLSQNLFYEEAEFDKHTSL